jgi:hypothetical protein
MSDADIRVSVLACNHMQKGRASKLYTVSLYTPHVQRALIMKHKGTYKWVQGQVNREDAGCIPLSYPSTHSTIPQRNVT